MFYSGDDSLRFHERLAFLDLELGSRTLDGRLLWVAAYLPLLALCSEAGF